MDTRLITLLENGVGVAPHVAPSTPIGAAIQSLLESPAGAVGVYDGERVVGLVTARDVFRRIASLGDDPWSHPVGLVMSSPAYVVEVEATVRDALRLMQTHQVRRLALVDHDAYRGVLSLRAVSSWLARDLAREVNELNVYICGRASIPPDSSELDWAVGGHEPRVA